MQMVNDPVQGNRGSPIKYSLQSYFQSKRSVISQIWTKEVKKSKIKHTPLN